MTDGVLLQMRDIQQHFRGVHALKGVNFDLYAGEIHALLGENGAGKSTLMHILAGVYTPGSGTININGQEISGSWNEYAAQKAGVAIVYQERSLVESLSVAENIFFGRQPLSRSGIINYARMNEQARQVLNQLELSIDPKTRLSRLSSAQQQMVEIAKALSLEPKLFILDEPTAALTNAESESLFQVIRRLRAQGAGIIYITHRLREVFELADRVTVLKDGQHRGTLAAQATNSDELLSLMVGREVNTQFHGSGTDHSAEQPAFEIRHLSDAHLIKDVSLRVWPGEVVALAGLIGAGRTELALAIFGINHRRAGEILVNGQPRTIRSPQDAIAAGIGYLPEERRTAGLFLGMSLTKNVVSASLDQFGRWWLDENKMRHVAEGFRERLQIAAPDIHTRAGNLSGGNQQKVVLSRWLLVNPRVLIVDEPTRGIDVGAKSEVHALLRELANSGTAIILISSELPEVLGIADRIYVMRKGRLTGELSAAEATEEKILRYMSPAVEEAYVS